MSSQLPAAVASGSQQMDPATQALCFFYRNPPRGSGVKPQPYKKIPQLIKQPRMEIGRIKMAVKHFGKKKKKRGRKVGWRKTTPKEDKEILAVFKRIRQPLGILVEASDVWSQGVGGLDLVTFSSEQHLARDLGLTPFVAAKVLKLRNQYLAVGV